MKPDSPPTRHANLPLPTLGGQQLWADLRHFHQWRIQQHVLTGHCRLLDGHNIRRAWGDYQLCEETLEQTAASENIPPMSGEAVVVLHGLIRTRGSMNRICRYLREEGGYDHVINVSYPSTRLPMGQLAAQLATLLGRLDGITRIDLVAHSLGNIVIRHYLADQTDPAGGQTPDPRIGRMVMIGPPNHGSRLASRVAVIPPVPAVLGPAGRQLSRGWDQLEKNLATPAFEFGILAGGQKAGRGYNPLLRGDDDIIVSVEETRLVGARDFAVLPVQHTFMMSQPRLMQYTLTFLRHGCFIDEEHRQPIEAAG